MLHHTTGIPDTTLNCYIEIVFVLCLPAKLIIVIISWPTFNSYVHECVFLWYTSYMYMIYSRYFLLIYMYYLKIMLYSTAVTNNMSQYLHLEHTLNRFQLSISNVVENSNPTCIYNLSILYAHTYYVIYHTCSFIFYNYYMDEIKDPRSHPPRGEFNAYIVIYIISLLVLIAINSGILLLLNDETIFVINTCSLWHRQINHIKYISYCTFYFEKIHVPVPFYQLFFMQYINIYHLLILLHVQCIISPTIISSFVPSARRIIFILLFLTLFLQIYILCIYT